MVKTPGIVELLDRLGGLRPSPSRELRVVDFRLVEEDGIDGFPRGLEGHLRALLIHVVPFLARRVGEQRRVATAKLIGQTHIFGMVGDREPVQRPVQSDFQAAVDGINRVGMTALSLGLYPMGEIDPSVMLG